MSELRDPQTIPASTEIRCLWQFSVWNRHILRQRCDLSELRDPQPSQCKILREMRF